MAPPAGVKIVLTQTVGGNLTQTAQVPLGAYDGAHNFWSFSGFFFFPGGLPTGTYEIYA